MLSLLVIWAALLVALVLFAIRRSDKGGALTLAYFLALSLVHVPGVLPFLAADSGLADVDETQVGFQMTVFGMAAFVAGAVLARWIDQRRDVGFGAPAHRRALSLERLGRRAFVLGIFAYFVLVPLCGRIPSLTSVVAAFGTLLIIGLWLALYGAAVSADRSRMLTVLALLPLLPLATLVLGGFVGYGVSWILSIIAFLFVISRRRIWFYAAALPVTFLGLSLFVTYMGQRTGIREVVWHEQSGLLDRLDRASSIITKFKLLDLSSPEHIAALDGRLNQNWLVGAGVMAHEGGGGPFRYGATVPPWAFIPRAVWPNKPEIGGGGSVVTDFTGITFAEGTSVGPGNVLEFYINFGVPGVLIGFLGLGVLLMRLDQGVMRSLAVDDMRGLLLRAMPGLVLLNPQGNLVEMVVGGVAAYIAAHLIISLKFFDVSPPPRPRRLVA